jgi:hypothetical protein
MPLRSAMVAGIKALLRVGGEEVQYVRGDESIALRLLPAEQMQEAEARRAFVTDWSQRDWIGLLESLVLDGERTTPQIDDRIEIETEQGTEVWTVAPDREQCWSALAGCRDGFRVHTVRTT